MKNILVLGAGGFIGHHLIKRLVEQGSHVTGVDLKHPEFEKSAAQKFVKSVYQHQQNQHDAESLDHQ